MIVERKMRHMNPSIMIIFLIYLLTYVFGAFDLNTDSTDVISCSASLVESIPENLTYPAGSISHPSTYKALSKLIDKATHTIEIASFYWTLRRADIYNDSSAWQGEDIFNKLIIAGRNRSINLRIVQNIENKRLPNKDTRILAKEAFAKVRSLNVAKFLGSGILHTKMWLIDRTHFYVGSANLDWRSLTQVKEMGAVIYNCPALANDMGKLFDIYWYMAAADSIPKPWPKQYDTQINSKTPMELSLNDNKYDVYISSSPPPFCTASRTIDIDAIVKIINSAKKFVYIAVMDYSTAVEFSYPHIYWPVIDDALRNVSFTKGIKIRLLGSAWAHTKPTMFNFLKSLQALNGARKADIQVKMFHVPAFTPDQARIPYARVNHNKYMVTDSTGYIGTSNWSADYFISTAGLGLIFKPSQTQQKKTNMRQQLEDTFLRDWNSKYSKNI